MNSLTLYCSDHRIIQCLSNGKKNTALTTKMYSLYSILFIYWFILIFILKQRQDYKESLSEELFSMNRNKKLMRSLEHSQTPNQFDTQTRRNSARRASKARDSDKKILEFIQDVGMYILMIILISLPTFFFFLHFYNFLQEFHTYLILR